MPALFCPLKSARRYGLSPTRKQIKGVRGADRVYLLRTFVAQVTHSQAQGNADCPLTTSISNQ